MRRAVFLRCMVAAIVSAGTVGSGWAASRNDALFRAIASNDAAAVRRLLAAGVDPNSRDERGDAALYVALREEVLAAAQALLQSTRVDVNQLNGSDESPLMMAAFRNHLELARQLVARGAAVNKDGWTPLHYAATRGHVEMMRYLILQGANINALSPNGTTPLMMAAGYGTPQAVRLLLQYHADPQAKNQRGLAALDFARNAGHEEAAALLEAQVDLGW